MIKTISFFTIFINIILFNNITCSLNKRLLYPKAKNDDDISYFRNLNENPDDISYFRNLDHTNADDISYFRNLDPKNADDIGFFRNLEKQKNSIKLDSMHFRNLNGKVGELNGMRVLNKDKVGELNGMRVLNKDKVGELNGMRVLNDDEILHFYRII